MVGIHSIHLAFIGVVAAQYPRPTILELKKICKLGEKNKLLHRLINGKDVQLCSSVAA